MKEILLDKFNCFNDPKFIFDEQKHRYTYDDDEFISVTTYISRFHKKFNTEEKSLKKSNDLGIPQEWILAEWKKINDKANLIGTETHQWIEDYFNKKWREIPTDPELLHRITKFNKIYSTHLYKLEPLKSEMRIFSKKWKIAGTIDGLFLYRGKIFILDYKTNKMFTTDDNLKYKERLLAPFNEFYKTHLNEYSIQISLYALILKEWGFDVAGGYLVYIGPGEEDAIMYKCIDFSKQLEGYLNQ